MAHADTFHIHNALSQDHDTPMLANMYKLRKRSRLMTTQQLPRFGHGGAAGGCKMAQQIA
eukprot:CAMPEP_0203746492 /NCGR_PEP_ID=MMETSP0098-20131031/1925_1 /ASSEMBLY_ACC=CAM_ASM_000208 /TAXON_ID=96639 /ORGANISM=" , Strain NY0313808BC1" /LENGTH=59 /DNA_ID=CAMNT_0050634617 /DNA_START=4164 /DNA_END=4343 /DNA_ORIENTATION=-